MQKNLIFCVLVSSYGFLCASEAKDNKTTTKGTISIGVIKVKALAENMCDWTKAKKLYSFSSTNKLQEGQYVVVPRSDGTFTIGRIQEKVEKEGIKTDVWKVQVEQETSSVGSRDFPTCLIGVEK